MTNLDASRSLSVDTILAGGLLVLRVVSWRPAAVPYRMTQIKKVQGRPVLNCLQIPLKWPKLVAASCMNAVSHDGRSRSQFSPVEDDQA